MRNLIIGFLIISLIFIAVAVFLINRCGDSLFSAFLTLTVIWFALSLLFLLPVLFLAFKNKSEQDVIGPVEREKVSDEKKITDAGGAVPAGLSAAITNALRSGTSTGPNSGNENTTNE